MTIQNACRNLPVYALGAAMLIAGPVRLWAQTKPPAVPTNAVEGKDGWGQIDQRLVFLTVQLSSVETSITATNKALKAAGYKLADRIEDAEKARARNQQMDRQGGGPVPWQQFYGRTAADFFYHPDGDGTVYVNPLPIDQRPPQFDYIYRANEDSRAKAESDAAAIGQKIEDLLAHRKTLEAEQFALWCKIAFRGISSKAFSEKPLYRFEPTTSQTGSAAQDRLAAIKAGSDFIHAADLAVTHFQLAVDTDHKSALDELLNATTVARRDADVRLLQISGIAIDLVDSKSAVARFRQAARQMQDVAENMVDAYTASTAVGVDDDPSRKSTSRGQFQQAVFGYCESVLLADQALAEAAKAWSITPDTSHMPASAAAKPSGAESIGAALQAAKSDNQGALQHARQELIDAIDARINTAADAGDLDAVKALLPAKESAARDQSIPAEVKDAGIIAAKGRYDQAVKSANEKLVLAYKQAVRDYTRARKFTEAQAAQDELKASGLNTVAVSSDGAAAQAGETVPAPINTGPRMDSRVKLGAWMPLSYSLPSFLNGPRFSAQNGGVQCELAITSRSADVLTKDFIFDVEVRLPDHGDPIFYGIGVEAGGGRPAHQTSIRLQPPEGGRGVARLCSNEEWGDRNELGPITEPGLYTLRVEKIGRSVLYSIGTEENKQFQPMYTRGVVDIRKFNEDLARSAHLYFVGGKGEIFTRARWATAESTASAEASTVLLPKGSFPIQRTLPAIMTGERYTVDPAGIRPYEHQFESISHGFLSGDYSCEVTFEVHKDRSALVGLGLAGKSKFFGLDMRPDHDGVSVALNHNEEWPKSFASIPEPGTYIARIDKAGKTVTFSVGTGEGAEFKPVASRIVGDIGSEAEELTATNTHLIVGGDTAYSKISINPPIVMPAEPRADAAPEVSTPVPPLDPAPATDTPPPVSATFAPREVNLLALVDPSRDAVKGNWRVQGGDLLLEPGNDSQLNFPYRPPAEFDYYIEFTRHDAKYGTTMIFPHDKRTLWWTMGPGDCGFRPLANDVPASTNSKGVPNDRRCRVRVEVRKDRLRGFINDKLAVDYPTSYSEFQDTPAFVQRTTHLGLEDWWSRVRFSKVLVTERSGPGTYVPSGDDTPQSIPAKALDKISH